MAVENDILNIAKAAAYLGIHIQTLRRLTRQNRVPGFKVGREWRFRRETLIKWADEQHLRFDAPASCLVYVVDDEAEAGQALVNALRRIGCEARRATTGARGMALIAEQVPDLVLLDLKMPDMTAPRFLAELRKTQPNLPVAIVTGHPGSDLMIEAAQHAPVMVVLKPVEREQLERTVQLVRGKQKTEY